MSQISRESDMDPSIDAEILHSYLLERLGKAAFLSHSDLHLIQSWLQVAEGDIGLVLLTLDELELGDLSRTNLKSIASKVTKALRHRMSLKG